MVVDGVPQRRLLSMQCGRRFQCVVRGFASFSTRVALAAPPPFSFPAVRAGEGGVAAELGMASLLWVWDYIMRIVEVITSNGEC